MKNATPIAVLRWCLLALLALVSAPALALDAPFTVAIKEAPPFVIAGDDGPTGLSIDLWDRVAQELGIESVYEMTTLEDLIEGVADGRYDAGISAISVTPAREEVLDLSHGYFTDGLGIAVPLGNSGPTVLGFLRNLFNPAFLSAVGALALLLLAVGIAVWIAERRNNAEQFNPAPAKGLGDGFWFAAVTMTTVGYGDKAPATRAGKGVALVWMFASIIVISAFTGAIASSLTAAQIDSGVRGPEDLEGARVGAIDATTSATAMSERRISFKRYDSVSQGLDALADGAIDALVHDAAILLHSVRQNHPGDLRVLDSRFNAGSYAVALPPGSPLREEVNRAILEITLRPDWQESVQEYLGITP